MYSVHQPEKSVFSLCIWEPITCLYGNINIISLLISWLICWQLLAGSDEYEGTAFLTLKLNIYNIFTQLLMIVMYLPIRLLMGPAPMVYSCGIWPVFMVVFTRYCMANPNESNRFCCFPCMIMNKYQPFLLCFLFSVLGGMRIDMWIGLGAGLILENFPWFDAKTKPSLALTKKFETILLKYHGIGRFTTLEDCGMNFEQPSHATGSHGGPVNQPQGGSSDNNNNPFQGKGVVIKGEIPGPKTTAEAFSNIASEQETAQRREAMLQAALKRQKKSAEEKLQDKKNESEEKLEDLGTADFDMKDNIEIDLDGDRKKVMEKKTNQLMIK